MIVGELFAQLGFTVDKKSMGQADAAIRSLKSTAVKVLGALGVGLSIKGLVNTVDTYQTINDKIIGITKSQEQYKEAQQDILAASKELRTSYSSLTSQVESLMKSGKATTVADAIEQIKKNTDVTHASIRSSIQSVKDDFGVFVADLFESTEVAQKVGDKIEYVGKRIIGLLNRMRPYLERLLNLALKGVDRVVGWIDRLIGIGAKVVDFLGGAENALRLIGIAIGIIVAYEIITKLSTILGLLSKFGPVILIVTALAFAIEDFIGFLQGKDSLIGRFFDMIGIGSDNARQKIFEFGNNAKKFIQDFVNGAKSFIGNIVDFVSQHSERIGGVLEAIWNDVSSCFNAIGDIISVVVELATSLWGQCGDDLVQIAHDAFDLILVAVETFFNYWAMVFQVISAIINGDWAGAMEAMKTFALDTINNILSVFGTDLPSVVETIKTVVNDAITFLSELPGKAFQWGADMISNFLEGVKSLAQPLLDGVEWIAGGIKSLIHFSEPDEGPLSDFSSYAPDMMSSFTQGILDNSGMLIDAVASVMHGARDAFSEGIESITTNMQQGLEACNMMLSASMANMASLNAAMVSTSNNISQRVNITNQFSGDRAAQLQGAKAMNKSAKDASAYMADALRFGR